MKISLQLAYKAGKSKIYLVGRKEGRKGGMEGGKKSVNRGAYGGCKHCDALTALKRETAAECLVVWHMLYKCACRTRLRG